MNTFFTDSNSELWHTIVDDLGLQYISMPYTLEGVEKGYDLGKTYNFNEFFAKVKQGIMPKTSALSPQNYVEIFEPFLKEGKNIIYVHFSSALSGTFEFMKSAIKELKEKYPNQTIKYVDTLNISLGAGLIAYKAAMLWKNGATDEEIIKFVESFRNKISVYFVVDSLHHLKRGGRISSTKAVIGSVLGVKPILSVQPNGKLTDIGKATGTKKAMLEIIENFKNEYDYESNLPIGILHANAINEAQLIKEKLQEIVGTEKDIWLQEVGPTVGTHCGPGTFGIAFEKK